MDVVHAITKKWGNSLGLVIPKNVVEKLKLKEQQDIEILVFSKPTRALFGTLPLKITGQQAKDLARRDLW